MVTLDEALKAEKQLYLTQGIQAKHFRQTMVHVSEDCYISTIILDKIPKKSNQQLLLIHGYNACKGNMFRFAELLHDYFYVVIIDLPGMNFSKKSQDTPFQCIDTALEFFIKNLKDLISQLELKNFYLAAHSLGGFLSTHLFDQMHKNIRKLILISPCGFNQSEENELNYQLKKLEKERWWPTRYFIKKYALQIFENKKSSQEIMPFRPPRWLTGWLIKTRFKMTRQQAEYLSIITNYNIESEPYGERCFGYLFDYGIRSKKPIINILEKYKDRLKDVCIFWGQNDYMDKEETRENLLKKKMIIETHIIKDSKHSIQNENFTDLADKIIKFILNKDVKTQRFVQNKVIEKQKSEIYNHDHIKEKKLHYSQQNIKISEKQFPKSKTIDFGTISEKNLQYSSTNYKQFSEINQVIIN